MGHSISALRTGLTFILYFLTQGISRGGDWAIQNYFIYTYDSWLIFIPAVATGAIFNVSAGYFFQKVLVFRPTGEAPIMRHRFSTFVVLRAVFGAGAFVTLTILYLIWPEPYWIYSGIVTVTMWVLSYQSQRDVFTGTLRQLPRPVRKTRVLVFKTPRHLKQLGARLSSS